MTIDEMLLELERETWDLGDVLEVTLKHNSNGWVAAVTYNIGRDGRTLAAWSKPTAREAIESLRELVRKNLDTRCRPVGPLCHQTAWR